MTQSKYSLSWESFHKSMCTGFSSLQQNGEFVDMTLAADGHFVKVHQIILGLASPYLKELLHSAPSPHPVLFLNNVTHNVLCSLLEYIYTGEVIVSSDTLPSLFETAKALRIRGLEDMTQSGDVNAEYIGVDLGEGDTSQQLTRVSGIKTIKIQTSEEDQLQDEVTLPNNARNICLKREGSYLTIPDAKKVTQGVVTKQESLNSAEPNVYDEPMQYDSDREADSVEVPVSRNPAKQCGDLQYTVSNRGSLQLILNRYMYNLHSKSRNSNVRRWRCVEYRNNRCLAFVTTDRDVVLNRTNMHNHSFHDKRILSKIEKKAVFSALKAVQGVQFNDQPSD